jgi:sortase A
VRKLRFIETLAWIVGAALVTVWASYKVHGYFGSQSDIAQFEAAKEDRRRAVTALPATAPAATTPSPTGPEPRMMALEEPTEFDRSLWAEGRIREHEESLHVDVGTPQAIFRIPKLELEVAVLAGTSDLVLNRGLGWIEGTAPIGTVGNVGIAGHRDGFFRGLKDIETGDRMELETLDGIQTYEIDQISIVQPEDVYVLAPSDESRITLVTCYPFYFVGKAPLRYIVHGRQIAGRAEAAGESRGSSP